MLSRWRPQRGRRRSAPAPSPKHAAPGSAPANAEGGGSGHASHTFRRGDRRMGAECRCMADTPVDDGLDTDDESGAPALVTMGLTPDIASPLEEVGDRKSTRLNSIP